MSAPAPAPAAPRRTDLRHLPICSVDPPGCKDIDDALHVVPLPGGNFELGVHIADVTHFLLPGTAMDGEAAARATTVYLVQRRIDMLPKPLTEDICSLRAGVDRLAFSVIWEVTPEAEVRRLRGEIEAGRRGAGAGGSRRSFVCLCLGRRAVGIFPAPGCLASADNGTLELRLLLRPLSP